MCTIDNVLFTDPPASRAKVGRGEAGGRNSASSEAAFGRLDVKTVTVSCRLPSVNRL